MDYLVYFIMQQVVLKYHLLFAVSILMMALIIFGGYEMLTAPSHFWHIARVSPAALILASLATIVYLFYTIIATSYEFFIDDRGLVVRRIWGKYFVCRVCDIKRILKITENNSLIVMNNGRLFLLSGLTPTGIKCKVKIEFVLKERMAGGL